MSNCSYETALRLKRAGLPQPKPKVGQVWYGVSRPEIPSLLTWENLINRFESITLDDGEPGEQIRVENVPLVAVFAPDLDYITAHLPEGWHFDMWDGRHSCKFDNVETTIRTQADGFAEAAALVYISLNEKTPATDVSETGAPSE